MRNSLIFDSVDTLDYGVVIDGEAVFDAPERDVEVVTIPGRNGTLQIDNGRFENIEVTYPASIWADAHGDFKTKIRDLRNAFASKRGYKRLTDTYHADEYRLGVFKAGLECDPGVYNTAAEFDIVFDCKPQRFLTSGETSVDVSAAAAQSFSGNPISVNYATGTTVSSFVTTFTPIQPGGNPSGYGYSRIYSPTRGYTNYTVNGSASSVAWQASSAIYGARIDHVGRKVYKTYEGHTFTGSESITRVAASGSNPAYFRYTMSNITTAQGYASRYEAVTYSALSALQDKQICNNGTYVYIRDDSLTTAQALKDLMIEWNTAGEPLVYVGKRSSEADVTSSVAAASFTANASNELKSIVIVTEPTPIVYGTISLNINGPVNLVNETDFEARPLLSVTGTGTVNIGDVTITIGGGGTQMYIDCDIAEAWSYSGGAMVNRNGDVSMSSADFPSLPPGANVITFSSGITQVLVTPRWWRV